MAKLIWAGGSVQNKENRYNDNLLFGSFKGKRKFSSFLLNGNTAQDGLNWQDEQKYGGADDNVSMSMDDDGGMMFMWRGGSNDEEPYVDPQNGYMTNVNAGIQYTNKWNDKQNFNLSPKYNSQQYTNHKTNFTQTQVGDSALNLNSNEVSNVNRHNFKIRGIYDVKIDSMNSLKLTFNTNFYHTESDDSLNSVSTGDNRTLKNTSNRRLQIKSDKSAISGNLLFKHKFAKERRTLSVTADWSILDTQGKDFLRSFNQAYLDGEAAGSQQLDQMKDFNTSTKNLSAKLVYTEPLGKKYSMELGYQLAYNYGNNDQLTYSYSPVSNKYETIVDSLSNKFKQNILQNIPSAKLNYADKKIKINIGSGFGLTHFELQDLTFNKDYTRNYVNFYPTANINYTYKANHSIRLNYNGNTTQPTIDQLQPLRNNNDYFNQYIGNPDLKPSFTNSFNLSHDTYNFISDIFAYQSLNVRGVNNSITNNQIINIDSGKTITQPINTNGNMSINLRAGMGFKIKKINTQVYFGPNINYSKYANVVNSQKSFSKTFAPGVNLDLSKSKEKKYDVSIRDQVNYNSNTTSQNNTRIHYFSNSLTFNGTLYIKKVWSVITDYTFNSRQNTLQFANLPDNHLWNARVQRTFKENEFSAYFSVRDILDQNIGITRNFYGNTYSEVTNDRLKRYFLIGFTWNFKNKAAKSK